MKNCWRLSDFSFFSVYYAYADHNSYLAEPLLNQNRLRVQYKGEMVHKDLPYCLVMCKVRKKDTERFEEVLGELKNKMLLTGHRDYIDFCEEIGKIVENESAS